MGMARFFEMFFKPVKDQFHGSPVIRKRPAVSDDFLF
jgi:hypothetical protein